MVLAAELRDFTPLQQAAGTGPPELLAYGMHGAILPATWPHVTAASAAGAATTASASKAQTSFTWMPGPAMMLLTSGSSINQKRPSIDQSRELIRK